MLTTPQLSPHNLAAELLDHIMTFVPTSSIPACTRVNSAFYLAAKPHLYREVRLDSYFYVVGANHALDDLDVGPRPLFRRAWMTRCTDTLDVAAHHESFCAAAGPEGSHGDAENDCHRSAGASDYKPPTDGCHRISHSDRPHLTGPSPPLLPPLPHVHTLRIPFDVHSTLSANDEPAPCGLHTLPIRHLVHRDFYWTAAEPTTSSLPEGSLNAYTAFIDRREQVFEQTKIKDYIQRCGAVGPRALVTFVYPPPPMHLVGSVDPTGSRYVYSLHQPPPPPTHFFHPPPPPVAAFFPSSFSPSDSESSSDHISLLRTYLAPCPHHANCVHNLFLKLALTIAACTINRTGRVRLVGFEDISSGGGLWVHAHLAFLTRSLFVTCAERNTYGSGEGGKTVVRRLSRSAGANSRDRFLIVERGAWTRSCAAMAAMSPFERRLHW